MMRVKVRGRSALVGLGGTSWQPGQPTALLLHGAGCDHTVWALQARSLGQNGWNVVAPAFPGHGPSEDVEGIQSIGDYADWSLELLEALEKHETATAVVGHSMGACIALEVAARLGDRARGLALLGAGQTLRVNPALLADTLERPLNAHRFIAAFGHGRASHVGGSESPGLWLLGSTLALLRRCEPEVLHRDFAACNDWEAQPSAGQVRSPSLVLSGSADRMTPPKAGRALAADLGGSEFQLLDNVGHMMLAEAPTRVTDALKSFLAA